MIHIFIDTLYTNIQARPVVYILPGVYILLYEYLRDLYNWVNT